MDDRQFSFSTKSLLGLTLQIAISMVVWSGLGFMPVFAIPLAVLAIAGFVTGWRCWIGAGVGAILAAVAILLLGLAAASLPSSFPQVVIILFVVALFGAAMGTSIHIFFLRWRLLGVVMAIITFYAFQFAWMMPSTAPVQGTVTTGP